LGKQDLIDRNRAQELLAPQIEKASKLVFGRKENAPTSSQEFSNRIVDVLIDTGIVAADDEPLDAFLQGIEQQTAIKGTHGDRVEAYRFITSLVESLLRCLRGQWHTIHMMPDDVMHQIHLMMRGHPPLSGEYVSDSQTTRKDGQRLVVELVERLKMLGGTTSYLWDYYDETPARGPKRNEALDQSLHGLAKLYAEFRKLPDPLVLPRTTGVSFIGFASTILQPFFLGSASREALTKRWSRIRARETRRKRLMKKRKTRQADE
jgi:hypothetical protein